MAASISFRSFYTAWREAPEIIYPVAHRLYHWAYYSAFMVGLDRIRKESQSMPGLSDEVSREPRLLSYFERALEVTAALHIDPDSNQVFDLKFLGRKEDYFHWHDAGHTGVVRNAKTYDRRLEEWISIFEHGKPTSYEEVLEKRMTDGTDGKKVPYWMIWNYGSEYMTGREGYPNHGGIHFVEAAEASLPGFKKRAMGYLQTYILALLMRGNARRPLVLGDKNWQAVYDDSY